ncbi:four helix bundle protein [Candidatus Parcubacteria bacterium]|nr:four helix bundle protein [Patescibacteria group bacterium]MCG2694431.1 four helix bundle protein [Candidatus Parcubacteria bacterium]
MEDNYFKLENIAAYKIASELSDYIWEAVIKWDSLNKYTIGSQLINSMDSVAANIAEGFGRFHKKDKIKFFYNSRGSVYESAHWCKKAYKRKLLDDKEFNYSIGELRKLPKEINGLINITDKSLKV